MATTSRPQVSRPQIVPTSDILHFAKPRRVQVTNDVKPCFVWYAKADCNWYPKSHPEAGVISATLSQIMQRLADGGALAGYRPPHPGNGGIWFTRWADAMAALTRTIDELEALQAI